MDGIDFGSAFIWFTSFLFSTTFHEAAHAYVAWRGGDPTAYHGGQVSLSPAPHVAREPIGMLALPLLTSLTQGWAIGWASAPYDPVWAERHPKRAALMAAAGPAANFTIAITAFGLIRLGLAMGWFIAPDHVTLESIVELTGAGTPSFVTSLLSVLLVQNVFLGIFNMLPLPPLDGASVFSIFLPEGMRRSMNDFAANGMMSMLGLVIAWQVFPMFTGRVFSLLLMLVHPSMSYS
jgi:Zn-dependent protease